MEKALAIRRIQDAKRRVLRSIAEIGRHRDENGQSIMIDDLNDRFHDELLSAPSLSDAYSRLSREQRVALRQTLENPAVDYISSDKHSWSEENLRVLDMLEDGKSVALGTPR